MISFLIILVFVSAFSYGFGINALIPVLIAVGIAALLDLLIGYFKSKTWAFPQSAMITGLLIGGLLSQKMPWYIYFIAPAAAILSKHLIRFNNRHIFNPANFGILIVALAFGAIHSWWIASPVILVLIFGVFIIWRLRRLDLALSFLISYFALASIIGLFQGAQIIDAYYSIINGGIIFFFSMYMIIEPKTNPFGKKTKNCLWRFGCYIVCNF